MTRQDLIAEMAARVLTAMRGADFQTAEENRREALATAESLLSLVEADHPERTEASERGRAEELARCVRIVEGEAAACFGHAKGLKLGRVPVAKMHTCAGNTLLAAAHYMKQGGKRSGAPDFSARERGLRIGAFRELVEREVTAALVRNGGGKHYEGRVEYSVTLPPVMDSHPRETHVLRLDCYILGPGRHYQWHGDTEGEVFDKAEADFREWVREDVENNAEGEHAEG